jgi:hypothetical protein
MRRASVQEMGSAATRRYTTLQPGFTRYTVEEIERIELTRQNSHAPQESRDP